MKWSTCLRKNDAVLTSVLLPAEIEEKEEKGQFRPWYLATVVPIVLSAYHLQLHQLQMRARSSKFHPKYDPAGSMGYELINFFTFAE